jgi:acyl carrier protein
MSNSEFNEVLSAVCSALHQVDRRIQSDAIQAEKSLIDDFGLDSLKFIDLTLALQQLVCIPEFPMEQWMDQERLAMEPRYTVGSLVRFCIRLRASTK